MSSKFLPSIKEKYYPTDTVEGRLLKDPSYMSYVMSTEVCEASKSYCLKEICLIYILTEKLIDICPKI